MAGRGDEEGENVEEGSGAVGGVMVFVPFNCPHL